MKYSILYAVIAIVSASVAGTNDTERAYEIAVKRCTLEARPCACCMNRALEQVRRGDKIREANLARRQAQENRTMTPREFRAVNLLGKKYPVK